VVLGGGLLGLEAAAGLARCGMQVDVVELAPWLMGRQLDRDAAEMLRVELGRRRVTCHLGARARAIAAGSVELAGGATLPADLVVVSAGVRPQTAIGAAAGLKVERGIVVGDTLRTSAPGVWAVGECAEHRGTVYGLWAPLAEQARVAGADIAGDPAAFRPVVPATTLKVAGIDLYAGGEPEAAEGDDEIVLRDTRRGRYRRLVVRGERLVGAVLMGDLADARRCTTALRGGDPVDGDLLEPLAPAAVTAAPLAPDTLVCSCNAVTAGQIDSAIIARGLTTLAGVANATRASTGCGGCAGDVQALLAAHRSSTGNTQDEMPKRAPARIAT
jgi:ferredoxin-nitrate reductase